MYVNRIRAGEDPLGSAFELIRPVLKRRDEGAFYTPNELVDPMVSWVDVRRPTRVVDAGCGSGRFSAAMSRRRPDVHVVAVDLDPLATLMTRATLSALGVTNARVIQGDFTELVLPPVPGVTAWIGNPPYVRHHQLSDATKKWAKATATGLGIEISGLAGLHALFYLATARSAAVGDIGCFVTSSEWLDVNYGRAIRTLLTGALGGSGLYVVDPEALPFAKVNTTAAVTTFAVGSNPSHMRVRAVQSAPDLAPLDAEGEQVAQERLREESRWSVFLRPHQERRDGFVELGELCRVHRGTVTGSNATWVMRHASSLPDSVLYPTVTKARELFAVRYRLEDSSSLRKVADIPADLDVFESAERRKIELFLRQAKRAGVDKGYVASHRRSWWSIGLKDPAPILATYMARQPPAFVLNDAGARHINIAHGLYPRQSLALDLVERLAVALRQAVEIQRARTYAGGLMKWEPKEMERLLVPEADMLANYEHFSSAMATR